MQPKKPPQKPRPKRVPIKYFPRFGEYETLKRAWIDAHPASTPEEYQVAIFDIAVRCGI